MNRTMLRIVTKRTEACRVKAFPQAESIPRYRQLQNRSAPAGLVLAPAAGAAE